jgi:hypothetical protein
MRDEKFYLLDVNPNSDISIDTSFALATQITSYSYSQMIKRIVMMSADRFPVTVPYSEQEPLRQGKSFHED